MTNLAKSPSVSLARALLFIVFEIFLIYFSIPSNHISSFIDVRDTEEETLNTGDSLSEVTLWVISIVQIFSHIFIFIIIFL